MDNQIDKIAAALYEQGRIFGLGVRDALSGSDKTAADILRQLGVKEAADGGGNNFGGIGDASPTAPPATPSNDSGEKSESSNVVKDEKSSQNLPEGELAQGAVGETSNGDPEASAKEASANPFLGALL